jgi:hypothetical protein
MSTRHLFVLAAIAVVFVITPLADVTLPFSPSGSERSRLTSDTEIAIVGEMVPNDAWPDWFGRNGSSQGSVFEDEEKRPVRRAVRRIAFRTLCVRLCDGFYWPISHATRRDRFGHDARLCERSCPGHGRLFVHRNPGEEVNDMIDLDGRPYRKLPAAFLYRTQYIADCTCRGHPWEDEALARHRGYAEGFRTEANAKAR